MSEHLVSPLFCAALAGGNFHREILLIGFYMLLISFAFLNDMEILPNEGYLQANSGSTVLFRQRKKLTTNFNNVYILILACQLHCEAQIGV